MARAIRVALDLTLVSIRTIQPVASNLWCSAKTLISNTKAKRIVDNIVVRKIEGTLNSIGGNLIKKLEQIRDRQLDGEIKYLEKEIEKAKERKGKTVKPVVGTAWEYAKVEIAPPLTQSTVNGPIGKKFEDAVSGAANSLVNGLQQKIKDIEAEAARKIKEKEDKIKAEQAKLKAEADAKKKLEIENKKKEAEKLAKSAKQAEEKKKEEEKTKTKETTAKAKAKEETKSNPKPKETVKPKQKKEPPKDATPKKK